MIKNDRSIWTNPYRNHTRQNGIQRGRQDWSDLRDDHLNVARGIGNALVLGAALWAVIVLIVLFLLGVLE